MMAGWVTDGWPTALISIGTMPPVWTRKTGWPSARKDDYVEWGQGLSARAWPVTWPGRGGWQNARR
jgi:hypothetical protein